MYEFHGWINFKSHEPDAGSWEQTQAVIAALAKRLREAEEEIGGWFEARETCNGQIVVVVHGLRNHRQDGPRELFQWIAEKYPWSHGLLYVQDDEDAVRNNEFIVYRLARGVLTEHADPFLSPVMPTVEPSWEEVEALPAQLAEKLEWDRKFYESLGPERADVPCRSPGCGRGAVPLSVLCRRHHFEQVMARPSPFKD